MHSKNEVMFVGISAQLMGMRQKGQLLVEIGLKVNIIVLGAPRRITARRWGVFLTRTYVVSVAMTRIL